MFPLEMYLVVDLLGHKMALHLTLRNWQIIFQSEGAIYNPHQQCMWVPTLLYPCLHLLLSVFFSMVILHDGVNRGLNSGFL